MTLAAIPTIEWLATQLETSTNTVKTGLWVALMAGMLFATVHFIIMMVRQLMGDVIYRPPERRARGATPSSSGSGWPHPAAPYSSC